jgi:hypothetical protein
VDESSVNSDSASTYVGGWNKGDAIKFIGSLNEDGKESGMLSEIAESRKPEFISIRHLGMINNGVEDTTSDQVKPWIGAHENYTFTEVDGGTKFEVDTDTARNRRDVFRYVAKGFEILKKLRRYLKKKPHSEPWGSPVSVVVNLGRFWVPQTSE